MNDCRSLAPCLAAVLLAVALSPAYAAGVADAEAERARLAAERRDVETRYTSDRSACQGQFAITSCLDAARLRRRDAMVSLQAQQAALDQSVRRERALARQRQIDAKLAQVPRAGASAPPAAGARAVPPARRAPRPESAEMVAPPSAGSAPMSRADGEARARARFEARRQQALTHRQEAEARQAARAEGRKRPSEPLPTPAASVPAR